MRIIAIGFVALGLSACGQAQDSAATGECARSAVHEVAWTNTQTPDTITTRADGPSCAQAVVTFVARNGDGDPLWAFSSTYYDMIAGGIPPEGAAPISVEEIDRFLVSWADVTLQRSSELPAWREGLATLTESAETFSYDTPFEREAYEMLRGRNLSMICYAAAVEGAQCLVIDPLSNAPTLIVAYGP